MMKIILRLAYLFDNKKDRSYVSEAGKFLKEFDRNNPEKSKSQKKEMLKYKDIYRRKVQKNDNFLDG